MDKFSAMTTFAKVVETGSFTRAADVLALPKARVSQRVSDLERHLGVRLLNRTTRSLNLTEDGQAYFAKCQVILQEIDELEGALKGGSVEPRGKLRVEALVSVARWVIAPSLHEFQAVTPISQCVWGEVIVSAICWIMESTVPSEVVIWKTPARSRATSVTYIWGFMPPRLTSKLLVR